MVFTVHAAYTDRMKRLILNFLNPECGKIFRETTGLKSRLPDSISIYIRL